MWSQATDKIDAVSVNTYVSPLTISWSKADYRVLGYRVTDNEFPEGTLRIDPKPTGIEISGYVSSPWGYIDAVYMDLDENLVTLNRPKDILRDIPNDFLELIKLNYDSTPQKNFHFTAHADWEQLDPITGKPLIPAVTGTDSFVFFYTVLNNWTANKTNLEILMQRKGSVNTGIYGQGIYGQGIYGAGTYGGA